MPKTRLWPINIAVNSVFHLCTCVYGILSLLNMDMQSVWVALVFVYGRSCKFAFLSGSYLIF